MFTEQNRRSHSFYDGLALIAKAVRCVSFVFHKKNNTPLHQGDAIPVPWTEGGFMVSHQEGKTLMSFLMQRNKGCIGGFYGILCRRSTALLKLFSTFTSSRISVFSPL